MNTCKQIFWLTKQDVVCNQKFCKTEFFSPSLYASTKSTSKAGHPSALCYTFCTRNAIITFPYFEGKKKNKKERAREKEKKRERARVRKRRREREIGKEKTETRVTESKSESESEKAESLHNGNSIVNNPEKFVTLLPPSTRRNVYIPIAWQAARKLQSFRANIAD